ncbi:hypothetical protein Sste5344_002901 [Sporothrix stenoceras]
MAASPVKHVVFPSVLTLAGSWRHPAEVHLCDGTTHEKLFRKSVYLGVFGKGLLGRGSGFQLHHGPSKDDPILGAVGDKTPGQTKAFYCDPDSVIIIPQYGSQGSDSTQSSTTFMTATSVPSPCAEDGGRRSVFEFSVETGIGMKRETFQWRQIEKGDDMATASLGGFKLVRAAAADNADKDSHEDTLALLKWNRGWLGLPSAFSMEPGTLHFVGDGDQAQLGHRWALMAVLTAVRLLDMYMLGRTSAKAIEEAKMVSEHLWVA